MYALTDQQIEFIQKDIAAQGVRMEGLQQDLLDHICCSIEHELEPDGDFETFYKCLIKTFYRHDLKEIEEETITLLTLKNYYVMKKIMVLSGAVLTGLLIIGLILKFMHYPGAAVTLVLGVVLFSFVFLPLFFTLKVKEKSALKDKVVVGIATFAGILISLGVLFKVMHWPGANMMCVSALAIILTVFLPTYFLIGIRNPETKINTIVSSVFILCGGALMLILVRSPKASQEVYAANTEAILRSEQILYEQQKITQKLASAHAQPDDLNGTAVFELCDRLKQFLIQSDTGSAKLSEGQRSYISENAAGDYFANAPLADADRNKAETAIRSYNATLPEGLHKLASLKGIDDRKVSQALNDLIQLQIMISQNRAAKVLEK